MSRPGRIAYRSCPANQLMVAVNIFEIHLQQMQSPLDRRGADIGVLASDVDDMTVGFAMRV